jgi:DNA-binding response OmpR family regulator
MRTTTTIGDLTVSYAQQWVTMGEREINLSQSERRLLATLAQEARRVAPQDTLPEYICGRGYDRVA